MQTYNQKQSLTSRTLPCSQRQSKQPPLHSVLQTYQGHNWEKNPSPLLPLKQSPNSKILQGQFLNKENRAIPLNEVFDSLKEDESFSDLEILKKALKKINEGADIIDPLNSLETLKRKVLFFIQLVKKDETSMRDPQAPFLKINRIVGLMEQKWHDFSVFTLLDHWNNESFSKKNECEIEQICAESILELTIFKNEIKLNPLEKWFKFDTLSLMAPLFMALSQLHKIGVIQTVIPDSIINKKLRKIRQLMELNPAGITVCAHRGNGATNRSMGTLIPNDDNRRIKRCAENSPSAFKDAMRFVPHLDGIECDVFLSQDKVPILSHVEKVQEQLSKAQQEQYHDIKDDTVISDLTKERLTAINRTDKSDSNFMTLEDLLNMVVPTAKTYYNTTKRAFRVEVEMKGTKITKASEENVSNMEKEVTRVISQFKKKNPMCPLNILMFNGHPTELQGYSRKRMEKTALGALYIGRNIDLPFPIPADLLASQSFVDELRYMQFKDPSFEFTTTNLKNFILTLVYGAESAPTNVASIDLQPIRMMFFDGVNNYPKPLNDLIRLQEIKKMEEKTQKIHFLTDYPANAPYFKRNVTIDDVNGAFDAFFHVVNEIKKDLESKDEQKEQERKIAAVEKYITDAMEDIEKITELQIPIERDTIEKAGLECDNLKKQLKSIQSSVQVTTDPIH